MRAILLDFVELSDILSSTHASDLIVGSRHGMKSVSFRIRVTVRVKFEVVFELQLE